MGNPWTAAGTFDVEALPREPVHPRESAGINPGTRAGTNQREPAGTMGTPGVAAGISMAKDIQREAERTQQNTQGHETGNQGMPWSSRGLPAGDRGRDPMGPQRFPCEKVCRFSEIRNLRKSESQYETSITHGNCDEIPWEPLVSRGIPTVVVGSDEGYEVSSGIALYHMESPGFP